MNEVKEFLEKQRPLMDFFGALFNKEYESLDDFQCDTYNADNLAGVLSDASLNTLEWVETINTGAQHTLEYYHKNGVNSKTMIEKLFKETQEVTLFLHKIAKYRDSIELLCHLFEKLQTYIAFECEMGTNDINGNTVKECANKVFISPHNHRTEDY
jgi:hypothetical protein